MLGYDAFDWVSLCAGAGGGGGCQMALLTKKSKEYKFPKGQGEEQHWRLAWGKGY